MPSAELLIALDAQGRIANANPLALRALGLPLEGALGRTWMELLSDPEQARELIERERALMHRGASEEREERLALPQPAGERVWLCFKSAQLSASGAPEGLLISARDITERAARERELREELSAARSWVLEREQEGRELHATEHRLRLAVLAAGAGSYEWDLLTGEVIGDERTVELLGAPEGSPLSMQLLTARMHPEDRPGHLQVISNAVAGRMKELPKNGRQLFRTLRRDGVYRWIESAGKILYIDEGERRRPAKFSGLLFDIDEQVRASALLRESEKARQSMEERLMLAMESSSLGWWDFDPITQALHLSESARALFDLAQGEGFVFGDSARVMHPEDRASAIACFEAALDPQGDGSYHCQYRVICRDGSSRWIDSIGKARFEGQGASRAATGLAGVLWDITNEKADIEALHEADRLKNVFLATLAHELRNPLAPIRTAAQVLASPKVDASQVKWASGVIGRQVSQMSRLLDDLLDVARITEGRFEAQRERVALTSIVASAVEATRPLLDAKGHTLSVQLPANPPLLWVDPARMAQVLSNLLANSAKYTDRGGRVELLARVEASELRITVRDNGMGFAPQARERIFQMFAQTPDALHRAEGGLGIGLALVKGLIELHGGRVDARSAGVGQGSAFEITLPLESAPALPEASGELGALAPGAYRILIADDNRDAAESLGVLLGLDGHEIRLAFDGAQAVAAERDFAPDVAVLDIGMPGMTGYEAARALRQGPRGAALRLIALSGWGQPADQARAREAGFDHHMTKPVDPEKLIALIRSAEEARARADESAG